MARKSRRFRNSRRKSRRSLRGGGDPDGSKDKPYEIHQPTGTEWKEKKVGVTFKPRKLLEWLQSSSGPGKSGRGKVLLKMLGAVDVGMYDTWDQHKVDIDEGPFTMKILKQEKESLPGEPDKEKWYVYVELNMDKGKRETFVEEGGPSAKGRASRGEEGVGGLGLVARREGAAGEEVAPVYYKMQASDDPNGLGPFPNASQAGDDEENASNRIYRTASSEEEKEDGKGYLKWKKKQGTKGNPYVGEDAASTAVIKTLSDEEKKGAVWTIPNKDHRDAQVWLLEVETWWFRDPEGEEESGYRRAFEPENVGRVEKVFKNGGTMSGKIVAKGDNDVTIALTLTAAEGNKTPDKGWIWPGTSITKHFKYQIDNDLLAEVKLADPAAGPTAKSVDERWKRMEEFTPGAADAAAAGEGGYRRRRKSRRKSRKSRRQRGGKRRSRRRRKSSRRRRRKSRRRRRR